jgi:hypothetical protein
VQIPGSGDRLVTLSIKANGQVDINVMRVGNGSLFGDQPSLFIASNQLSDRWSGPGSSFVLDMMEYFEVRESYGMPEIPTKTYMRYVTEDEEITQFIFEKMREIPNLDHKQLREWIDERITGQLD